MSETRRREECGGLVRCKRQDARGREGVRRAGSCERGHGYGGVPMFAKNGSPALVWTFALIARDGGARLQLID